MEILKHVPMTDLTAMIWAGLHEYDANDEPIWPLKLTQVRRLVNVATIPQLFLTFLRGQASNSPTNGELGESQALSEPVKTDNGPATARTNGIGGGERSIELPEDAFA
jgi:hypothetical protein